jgi:glutaredoxin 1
MGFTAPVSSGFTIYGKSGCAYCDKVKDLLEEYDEQFIYVNCDEYLLENRDAFLEFIQKLAGKEYKTFPMVFNSAQFVGGYTDTMKIILDKHD